jgi:hypothetical protein
MKTQKKDSNRHGSRGDRRWTVLFIGDRGKTTTFYRFKEAVFAIILLFVLSLGVSGLFYSLYANARTEIDHLEKKIDNLKQAIASVRDEKDILTARLVVAESRVEEVYAQKGKGSGENSREPAPARKQTAPAPRRDSTPKMPPSVTAEKFIVYHEPDINTLRVEYRIVNTGSKEQPVSGRTVVVLKDGSEEQQNWLILPTVRLDSGRPIGDRGRSFSIYNYRTMRFKVNDEVGPDRYKTATIYVFTTEGSLLFEKEFSVGLKSKTTS